MSLTLPYRAASTVVERLRSLQLLGHERIARVPGARRELYGKRLGRVAAGTTGVLAAVAMFASVVPPALRDSAIPTLLLIGAWPAMFAAYVLGRCAGSAALRQRLRRLLRTGEDPEADLARLQDFSPVSATSELTIALETPSVAWPLAAISLLMPLSLHLGVYALWAGPRFALTGFSEWIAISALFVGHAHLALTILSVSFAKRLRRREDKALRETGWVALGIATAIAAMPGVILIGLPPLLTAVTGVVFIPAMYTWARRRVTAEDQIIAWPLFA